MLDLPHFTDAPRGVDAGENRVQAAGGESLGVGLGVGAGNDVGHGGNYTFGRSFCRFIRLFYTECLTISGIIMKRGISFNRQV